LFLWLLLLLLLFVQGVMGEDSMENIQKQKAKKEDRRYDED
jgi:hypothetical protein